jgi:transposase
MALVDYMLNKFVGIENTNFEVVDVKHLDFEIVWKIRHKEQAIHICPNCLKETPLVHSKSVVKLFDVPLGMKRQLLEIEIVKVLCTCTLSIRNEYLPFKAEGHRLTQRFVDYIEMLLCSKMLTVADTARIFGLDYGIVYNIDHAVLRRLVQHMEIPDPVNIAVDEKAWKRGHKYVTVVTDVDTATVIWVSEGRGKASLDEFFKILGPERCKKIETVSKDMHQEYADSCAEHIPQAKEVADAFHVIKHLNEAIDGCRKELIESQALSKEEKEQIKGTNWVLRYKQANLKDKNLIKLTDLETMNQPLFRAYLHKEAFYEIFKRKPEEIEAVKDLLKEWVNDALTLGFEAMNEFANFVKRHTLTILNAIQEKRSSSISEGINRKISVIIAMACGYKSLQYLKLKILQRCGVLGKYWRPSSGPVPIT